MQFVEVESFDFNYQADFAQSLLDQHEIESHQENGNLVAMDWFISNAVGGIKIKVLQKDAPRATEILKEYRSQLRERSRRNIKDDEQIVFRCSNCKKPISLPASARGRVEDCPRCKRFVDVPAESDQTLTAEELDQSLVSRELLANPFAGKKAYYLFELFVILGFFLFLPALIAIERWYSSTVMDAYRFALLDIRRDAVAISLIYLVVIGIVCLVTSTRIREVGVNFRLPKREILLGLIVGVALGLARVSNDHFFPDPLWVPRTESPFAVPAPWFSSLLMGLSWVLAFLLFNFCRHVLLCGYVIDRLRRLEVPAGISILVAACTFSCLNLLTDWGDGILILSLGTFAAYRFIQTGSLVASTIAFTISDLGCALYLYTYYYCDVPEIGL